MLNCKSLQAFHCDDCLIKEFEGSRKIKVFKFAWNVVGPFASGLVGPAEIAKVLSCVVIWDAKSLIKETILSPSGFM